jgi:hypothetical protein
MNGHGMMMVSALQIYELRSLDVRREDGPFRYHADQLWMCKANKLVSQGRQQPGCSSQTYKHAEQYQPSEELH